MTINSNNYTITNAAHKAQRRRHTWKLYCTTYTWYALYNISPWFLHTFDNPPRIITSYGFIKKYGIRVSYETPRAHIQQFAYTHRNSKRAYSTNTLSAASFYPQAQIKTFYKLRPIISSLSRTFSNRTVSYSSRTLLSCDFIVHGLISPNYRWQCEFQPVDARIATDFVSFTHTRT